MSPSVTHLLTGGHEKKVRMFDLRRPDAEPDFLCDVGALSHDGMVKSVIWVGDHTGVTAGEDGKIKYVGNVHVMALLCQSDRSYSLQVVGSSHS